MVPVNLRRPANIRVSAPPQSPLGPLRGGGGTEARGGPHVYAWVFS
jgi:hypothetical protein